MATPKVLYLSDSNRIWMYIDDTRNSSSKLIYIYDDKNENSISFYLDNYEMKYLADSIIKYLENNHA